MDQVIHPPHPVLASIARLDWIYAKTMPEIPHEYSLRKRARDQADYVALFEAIMRDGILVNWKSKPGKYLYPGDSYRYWDMSPKKNAKLEHSRHINRCKLEEVERLRSLGLVTNYDPAAKPVKPQLPYTRRFARVFQSMLGAHGYQLSVTTDEALVIAENKTAQVRVEIDNPNKQWASKTCPWKATRNGAPFTGAGRDALAQELGVPPYRRR